MYAYSNQVDLADYEGRYLTTHVADDVPVFWHGAAELTAFLEQICNEEVLETGDTGTHGFAITASGYYVSTNGAVRRI